MGVAGSGKTTIEKRLAAKLGWEFHDADDYHSSSNIDKMSRGISLEDAERLPRLKELRGLIDAWHENQRQVILAC